MSGTIKVSSPESGGFWEIPILYRDADLLALSKPAGLASSPGIDPSGGADLLTLLHKGIAGQKPWATELGLDYLMNAHRLDVETSGVLLFARSKESSARLADQFGADKVTLDHLVLVQGEPNNDLLEIDDKIGPDPSAPDRMRITRKGKIARTACDVIERFNGWALLRCRPAGNRVHQLRLHLRRLGVPVAGDALYGGKPLLLSRIKPGFRSKPGRPERPLVSSAAIHLGSVTLVHPATGQVLDISAPLPREFEVALKYLRRFRDNPKSDKPPR